MEKYRTDLLRVLENMNGRLVGLEKSCEQLALSVGELHTETTTQRENTDERLKALDLVSKEVARKVNILKDKMVRLRSLSCSYTSYLFRLPCQ